MAPPFLEEDVSDSDSISVTSTQAEPQKAEYAVEKINAEDWSMEEGVMVYLVKWEGYPLHEATWEPAESFLSEQILQEWEREKEAVKAGLKEPFDLDVYNEAKEIQLDEQESRKQRRAAKRRRLGMASRNGSISNGSTKNVSMRDADGDSEDSDDDRPLRQKRLKTSTPKRKVVAQKVTKSQNKTTSASSSEQSSDDGNTSEDSLLEETRRGAKVGQGKARSAASEQPAAGPASRTNKNAATSTTNASNKATAKRSSAPNTNATQKRALSSANARAAGPANRSLASSAARKSAPSTASLPSANTSKRLPVLPTDEPAKKSSSDAFVTSFLSSSTAGAARKQRKMSESDSRHMRFKSMSEQERFRKHARKEGVPDPSMLDEFNPVTGTFEKPASAASPTVPEQTRKTSLPLASPRQPVPPQQTRRVSLGPQATQPPPKPPAATMLPPQSPAARLSPRESVTEPPRAPRAMANAPVAAIHSAFGRRGTPAPTRERSVSPPSTIGHTSIGPAHDHQQPRRTVCWNWRNGVCDKPAAECGFAHHYITCPFWRRGECKNEEKDCKYDHKEDGLDATMPESRRTRPSGFDDDTNMRDSSPSTVDPANIARLSVKQLPATKVCSYWKKGGRCKFTDEDCLFAHYHITCPRWKVGNCSYDEKDCFYSHRYDDLSAAVPVSRELPDLRSNGNAQERIISAQPASAEFASSGSPNEGVLIHLKDTTCPDWASGFCPRSETACKQAHRQTHHNIRPKDIMCSFWLKNGCSKSDEKCKFAHWRTAYEARWPGAAKIVYIPAAVQGAAMADHHSLGNNGVQQSRDHQDLAWRSGDVNEKNHAIVDEGPDHSRMASPVDMATTPGYSSLPMRSSPGPPASTYGVGFNIKCGLDEFDASAKLACSTIQDISQVANLVGTESRLQLHRMVGSADLKHHFADLLRQGAPLPTGDVTYNNSGDNRMDRMAETYRLHVSCGVVQCPKFTLLLYPAGVEEWGFLARPGDVTSSQSVLKFKLLPPLPQDTQDVENWGSADIVDATERTSTSSSLAAMHLLHTDLERLLKISDTKTEARVFIMMPPSRLAEMKTIAAIFEDRFKQSDYKDRRTKVWTSEQHGSWDECLKNPHDNCLLLVHPEIALWDVSHLGKLLHTTLFRVFSVGVDPGLAALERRQPEFGCQRLFPMGDVVFITDDVFMQTPEKVLRIIDEINRGNKGKPAGATRNKMATRPGVRLWLMDLMMQKTGDRGREDPRWLKLLEAIWDLCPAEKDDEYHPGNPSEEKADLVSIPPEQLPTFQELLQTDQSKATDYIVNWFAGWSYRYASKFRRFTICHEEPNSGKADLDENYNVVWKGGQADPKGWGKEYQYLMVQTPDDWLKDKEKAAKAKAAVSKK